MKIPQTLAELPDFCRDVAQRLERLETQNLDLKKRRVVNAAPAVSAFDYVTKFDLDNAVRSVTVTTTDSVGQALRNISSVIEAASTARPAPVAYKAALLIETDTNKLYYSDGTQWVQILAPTLLKFMGSTSSFPALKRSSAILQARLADDTAYTDIEVAGRAYDATTWNGSNRVPSEDAVRDKFEALPLVFAPLQGTSFNPADATTYYVGDVFSATPQTTAGITGFYLAKDTTIYAAAAKFLITGTGSNEASTVYLRVNGTTDYSISAAIDCSSSFSVYSNAFVSPIAISAGQYVEIKWVTPTWVTNPTGVYLIGGVFFK
jgi:hypothetical protein